MTIGSVSVAVVPSAEGFNAKLSAQILPEADAIGEEAGERIRKGIDGKLSGIDVHADVHDEAAKLKIDELEAKIAELSDKKADINVDVHNASGVRSWLVSLVAGAVAIAPAFAVAATGVAAFGLLAIPTLKSVIDYEHDLASGSAKAAAEFRNLSPAEKEMVAGIADLKNEFQEFSSEVQPEVLEVFLALLHQAAAILPEVAGVAKAGGQALATMINEIGHAFTDSQAQQFFAFVEKNLPQDAAQIGQTVADLITLFFNLVEALHPVSGALLSVVDDIAKGAGALAQFSPALTDAIVLAIALAKPLRVIKDLEIASTFANMAKAIDGVAVASNAQGLQFGWLTKLSTGVSGAIASAEALKAAEFELAAGDAAFAVSAAGTVTAIGAEDAAFGSLAASETAAAAAMGALDALSPAVLYTGAAIAVAGLTYLLLQNTDTIDGQIEAQRKADDATGANVEGYRKLAAATDLGTASARQMTQAVQRTAPAYESARVGSAAYATATARVGVANQQANSSARNLASNLGQMERAFGLTQAQAEAIANKLPGVAAGFRAGGGAAQAATSRFAQYVTQSRAATSSATTLAAEEEVLSNSLSTAAQKAAAAGSAFNALENPTLSLADAAVAAANDQSSLAKALTASHDRLGTATQAERDATSATTAAARSAEDYSQKLLANGASASRAAGPLEALRGELEKAGVKGGIAAKLISELNAEIAALHSKTINIDVNVAQHGGATVGIGGGTRITSGPGHAAAGGIIPGWAPGYDSRMIAVSPGEGIAVPELVQAIGPQRFLDLNRKFAKGRTSTGVHFAGGGLPGGFNTGSGGGNTISETLNPVSDIEIYLSLTDGRGYQAKSAAGATAGAQLAKEFASGQLKTLDEIKTAEKQAIEDIKKYYTGPHKDLLIGSIEQQTAKLEELAQKSQAIADEIKNVRAYAAQETQSLQGFSNISNITGVTTTDPVTGDQTTAPITGKDISGGLAKDLAQLKKFESVIKQLKKAGVDKNLISQVIQLGPVDGVTYGEAILAGGKSLIAELNKDEKAIEKEETHIGQTAADIQYGLSISKGFLSGLKKEKAELDKQMKDLGQKIAEELEKALEKLAKKLGKGGSSSNVADALSPDSAGSALSVGGTLAGGTITRGEYQSLIANLRLISARELTAMTKVQGQEIITLLKGEPRKIADLTGPAVAKALNTTSSQAASSARASVRG